MVENTINEIREKLEEGKFEPFIRSITFPRFKNIEPNSTIEFTYPITAIVGGNGSNKTSILRALEGAPAGMSIGLKWFTTNVDFRLSSSTETDSYESSSRGNRSENLSDGERQCFFYRYQLPSGNLAEVLKARIKKNNDPDYWEPSRPVEKYKMEILNFEDIPSCDRQFISRKKGENIANRNPKDKIRWAAVNKEVIFFSFKYSIPAFDLHYEFFNSHLSTKDKKTWHRARAKWLSKIIDDNLESFKPGRKQRVIEKCTELSPEACHWVSKIIGRDYTSILLVKHCCFALEGYTVKLRSCGKDYSEAFAGSGEFSAVMLVNKVLGASKKSLILLDEPETSLHPKAQHELMNFLSIQAKAKGHQIVFATHSPECISALPPDAIKVLQVSNDGRNVRLLSQFSLPEFAFSAIGSSVPKRRIYVEDSLAQIITESGLNRLGEGVSNIEVVSYGAESVMAGPLLATLARIGSLDYIILDGDQHPHVKPVKMCNDQNCSKHGGSTMQTTSSLQSRSKIKGLSCAEIREYFDADGIPIIDKIPESKMSDVLLHIGCKTSDLGLDGGNKDNDEQSNQRSKEILEWVVKHVRYLSKCPPELLVLQMCNDVPEGNVNLKKLWSDKAKEEITTRGEPTSNDILGVQKMCLKAAFTDSDVNSNVYVNDVMDTLKRLLEL